MNELAKPHPYADPEPEIDPITNSRDKVIPAIEHQEVKLAINKLRCIFDEKVLMNNNLCHLEKIEVITRTGGYMIEAVIRCPEGDIVEVPFIIERTYSKKFVEDRIAQCLISKTIRAALKSGLRVNSDFYNLYSICIEPSAEGHKTSLVIFGKGQYHVIELPVQGKFTRDEVVTQVALQLMPAKESMIFNRSLLELSIA